MSGFHPERLSWIRKKRGLNKTELAEAIDADLRTISAYEAGEFAPLADKVVRLSQTLRVSQDFFSKGHLAGPDSSQVSFRSFSKLSSSKRDMALGSAAIAFALCEWVEKKFDLPLNQIPELRDVGGSEEAACELRSQWGLGEKPISNMVHLLESKGVRVFSLALDIADVDACCTWHNHKPFVFLNTKKSSARRRFDAAHELAHLVLHRHGRYEGRDVEKDADDFASAFLMPRDGFRTTAPRLPDLRNIVPNKSIWGVSIAAYVVRLHKLQLISDWHYRALFKQISQRGYRRSEPYDAAPEMSKLAEIVLKQLRREQIFVSDIAKQLGLEESDVNDLLFGIAMIGVTGTPSAHTNMKGSPDLKLIVDNS